MSLQKRIEVVEAAVTRLNAEEKPADKILDFSRLKARLDAINDGTDPARIERARREALPLVEQLALLRADQAAALERRAKGLEPPYTLTVLRDRLFTMFEADLLERIEAETKAV